MTCLKNTMVHYGAYGMLSQSIKTTLDDKNSLWEGKSRKQNKSM